MNHDAISVQICRSAGLSDDQTDALLTRLAGQPAYSRCQGTNCGATDGVSHSPECVLEAAEAQGRADSPEADEARRQIAAKTEPFAEIVNVIDIADPGTFVCKLIKGGVVQPGRKLYAAPVAAVPPAKTLKE